MKTMHTRVILSHIVYGARPCYKAIPDTEYDDMQKESDKNVNKKRKRRMRKGM